ncbi:hypothetical protein HGG75_27790 [Ochrobactrum pseudogrignonense]|nr:hypothetical protein [Brucella pseudogrignonensis]
MSSTTLISSALAQSVFSGGTLIISGEQTVADDFDLLTSGTVQITSGGNATLTGNIVTNSNMLTFSTLGTGWLPEILMADPASSIKLALEHL